MTHESLIENLTLFYHTLAALQYISSDDIISPPASISLTAAHEAGLSSEAIDLLQRLPHLSDDISTLPILPDGSQAVFYSDDCLDWSRTPTYQDNAEIPSTAFVLTNPNIYGTSLIYCTCSQKLLPWEAWGRHVNLEIAEVANPFALEDAKPVEEILGPWIRKLISLHWVPFETQIVREPDEGEMETSMRDADIVVQDQTQFVQWGLREVYIAAGWNDHASDLDTARKNFSGEVFATTKEEWMRNTQEVLNKAYTEQWSWLEIRGQLGGGLARNERARLLDEALEDGQEQRHIEL